MTTRSDPRLAVVSASSETELVQGVALLRGFSLYHPQVELLRILQNIPCLCVVTDDSNYEIRSTEIFDELQWESIKILLRNGRIL